jgi:transcriptional regulator GlxA family with amidase domain
MDRGVAQHENGHKRSERAKFMREHRSPGDAFILCLPESAGSAVRRAEDWLSIHFAEADPVAGVVSAGDVPERSLKCRFKAATGTSLMTYTHNLRIEAAKRALEAGGEPVESIAAAVGYENHAFFRRLFRRYTGLSPSDYRRMFQPYLHVA